MYAYENIEMSLNYIEQHLSEKIETEKLAEIACLSTFYYQRLFKRLVKRSVQEYIKLRRLAMVIAELNNSEERILDIALKYGFSDHANFTRAFKEVYHITPDEYRKNVPMLNTFDKVIWQCVTATKKGKKFCKHSKGIPETAIEEAFVESYRLLCDDNKDVLEEFLQRMDDTLSSSVVSKQLAKAEKEIGALEKKKSKLVDMRLEEIIDKETYESKYADLVSKQEQLVEERKKLQETSDNEKDIKKRLKEFKKTLEQNEVLDKFDRYVFESIVEKVIVGGLDENGNMVIGDEMLTPDSSRFWPADGYEAGHGQPSFDKQFARDWLKANPDNDWTLPQEIVDKTIEKYLQAYKMLTGKDLDK